MRCYRMWGGRGGVGVASVLDVQSVFYQRKLDLCHDQTSCWVKHYTLFFLQEQFYKNKSLGFGKKLEQNQACCPTEHNKKVSRTAILKIITTKHQNRSWLSFIFTTCRLVLLSHFNIAKLLNDHILFSPGVFDWLQ